MMINSYFRECHSERKRRIPRKYWDSSVALLLQNDKEPFYLIITPVGLPLSSSISILCKLSLSQISFHRLSISTSNKTGWNPAFKYELNAGSRQSSDFNLTIGLSLGSSAASLFKVYVSNAFTKKCLWMSIWWYLNLSC